MAMINRDLTMMTLSTDLNGSQIDWLVMVLAAHVLSATIPAWSVNQGALALCIVFRTLVHTLLPLRSMCVEQHSRLGSKKFK